MSPLEFGKLVFYVVLFSSMAVVAFWEFAAAIGREWRRVREEGK